MLRWPVQGLHGIAQDVGREVRVAKRHVQGTFLCAGCALPFFSSKTKLKSGTGWPSFYAPLPEAVETTEDHSFLMLRTEVHCRRCGGHLGHVFDD